MISGTNLILIRKNKLRIYVSYLVTFSKISLVFLLLLQLLVTSFSIIIIIIVIIINIPIGIYLNSYLVLLL